MLVIKQHWWSIHLPRSVSFQLDADNPEIGGQLSYGAEARVLLRARTGDSISSLKMPQELVPRHRPDQRPDHDPQCGRQEILQGALQDDPENALRGVLRPLL